MAIYTRNNVVGTPAAWYLVEIDGDSPASSSGTLLVLPNSDGTFTRIHGSGFTYDGITGAPTAGTISSIERSNDATGTTIYEVVTGLTLSLVALTSTEDNREAFALIFAGTDTFNGFLGNDYFVGGAGADTFIGDAGTDTVSYDNALAAVTMSLGGGGTGGDANGDTFTSIENIIGSDFNDSLTGNGATNNFIQGGLGNDTLGGGNGTTTGNDHLDGGAGSDLVNYANNTNLTVGITVTMSAASGAVGNGADAAIIGTDTFTSIESVRGTNFNDTYTATSSFSAGNGAGNEFEGRDGDDTITGNGSTRLRFTTATEGVTVNLLAGTSQSTLGGDAANVGVDSFAGTVGPNAINAVNAVRGSEFADTINAAGARGSFDFIGAGGNDTFIGTTEAINNFDNNEARYDIGAATPNAITVLLDTTSTVTGGAAFGNDTLINVERVRGTDLADTFTATANFTAHLGGQNSFEGEGGNDIINGNGFTTVRYANALAAVTVNLTDQTGRSTVADDAGVGVDTFTNIHSVGGSSFNDTLIGSSLNDNFGPGGGTNSVDGGGGVLDRVTYQSSTAGVTINLSLNFAIDSGGATDTLTNIEGAVGSEFNDFIRGKDGVTNRLRGEGGDDQIFGGDGNDLLAGDDSGPNLWDGIFGGGGADFDSGNDLLDGGAGADQMWGGLGNDVYVVDNVGDVVTENANEGIDTVLTANTFHVLEANVENLTYTDMNFIIALGNSSNNVLDASNATQTVRLEGLGGADQLISGSGNDLLYIDSLDTLVEGGDGFDFAIVQGAAGVSLNLATSHVEAAYGNAGIDILNASSASTTVSLTGFGGADQLTGGSGSDLIYFDSLDTVVQGGAGIDFAIVYFTETAGVSLDLAANNVEFAYGGVGNDIFDAGDATDTVFLYGAGGADQLIGGSGSDIIHFDNQDTVVQGGAGLDFALVDFASTAGVTLNLATSGFEFAYGGVGNDTFNASGATTTVQLFGLGGADQLTGGSGDDVLWFDSLDTVIQGGAGVDFAVVWFTEINGVTLDMTVADIEVAYGGEGNDVLTAAGTTENTRIVGLGGADELTGGSADDAIFGGEGNDQIFASAGNDYMQGDDGTDTVHYSGDSTDYDITPVGGGFYSITGAGIGTHTLFQVEVLHFDDTDIIL